MKMYKSIFLAVFLGILLGSSRLALGGLSFSTSDGSTYVGGASGLNQIIPDNNPSGVAYSINFGAVGQTIGNISVSLNLNGGYNGDLYAYLSNGSQTTTLFNQISGSPNSSGFNVTLVEGTANPIQTVTGFGAGTVLSGVTYTANQDLAAFNNTDPNGNWVFFVADLNAGDTSTLNAFSVNITAVPEPVNGALVLTVAALLLRYALRKFFFAKKQSPIM
jgi:subtilisin-like proprotein convertase family protein